MQLIESGHLYLSFIVAIVRFRGGLVGLMKRKWNECKQKTRIKAFAV